MNKVALVVLFFLALLLSACGGSGPTEPTSGLSGTVFAPPGGDVAGTVVAACYQGNCDDNRTQTLTLSGAGASAPYRFDNLERAPYGLVAGKDVNNNGKADAGDYGVVLNAYQTPPATVDLRLEVIGANGGGGGGGNPNPAGGAVFPDFADGTNGDGPVLLSDAGGALHLLYSAITQDDSGVYPVRYGTCSSGCSSQAGWTFTTVGDVGFWGGHGQLALDANGRPRVIYFNRKDLDEDGRFVYASCDADCTNSANWTQEMLSVPRPIGYLLDDTPYFALAPDGTLAFVYITQDGTYYAYRSGGRWAAIQLSEDSLFNISLAFTSASQPRMVFHYTAEDDESHLAYLACGDKTCANYDFANLPTTVGYQANAVLRLNTGDAPRVLNYSGETLQYLSCNNACTNAASWNVSAVGTEDGYGQDGIALVLDGAGQPHISYGEYYTTELLYGFCSAACESANPSWRTGLLVENSDEVERDVASPLPNCSSGQTPFGYWYPGNAPSMTLNGGQPSFAYRVDNLQGCDGKLVAEGPSIVRFSNATPTATPTAIPTATPTVVQTKHDQADYNRASHHQADYDAAGLERLRHLQNASSKGSK